MMNADFALFFICENSDNCAEHLFYVSYCAISNVYCVINRFEVAKLKEIIHGIDPHAFVAINDVTDSMSKNLRYSRFQKRATIQVEKDGVIQEITPVETTAEEVTTSADTTEK